MNTRLDLADILRIGKYNDLGSLLYITESLPFQVQYRTYCGIQVACTITGRAVGRNQRLVFQQGYTEPLWATSAPLPLARLATLGKPLNPNDKLPQVLAPESCCCHRPCQKKGCLALQSFPHRAQFQIPVLCEAMRIGIIMLYYCISSQKHSLKLRI